MNPDIARYRGFILKIKINFKAMIIYKRKDNDVVIPCGLGPVICPDTSHNLQMKMVDSSTVLQHVEPDSGYYGLYRVIVNPIYDANLLPGNIKEGVEILGVMGTYAGELINIQNTKVVQWSEVPYLLQWAIFEPDEGYDAMRRLQLRMPKTFTQYVTPSTSEQSFRPQTIGYDFFRGVEVAAVTADIDPDIQPGNIKKDVEILGVIGTYEGAAINNQSKTVNSSVSSQTVTYDSSYTGLSSVTVNPYTVESKNQTITQNGTYTFAPTSADALSDVSISVQVAGTPATVQAKSVSYNTNGEYTVTPDQGYDGLSSVDISVNVPTPAPVLQSKTVDSSTESQSVAPDQGYDGLSQVTVNPYTVESDSSTLTQNGTYSFTPQSADALSSVTIDVSVDGQVINNQNKTVNPSTNSQSVTADSGYTGLGTVTVNPMNLENKFDNPYTYASAYVDVTADAGYDGLSKVRVFRPKNDSITVNSSTVAQEITPASRSTDYFNKVTVNPYTVETDSSTLTQNGTYTFTPQNADALSSVTVDVSVEGGSGDSEEWPALIVVYNNETPAHAGVVFDSGFPITDENGMTNQTFEGYFSLGGQLQPSQYFVFGNLSSVDQSMGVDRRYYWGIWVNSDSELVVSFGAEDEGESAVFTFDEVSPRDLPITWERMMNEEYGTEDDEYGTEYIYEVRIGDVTKYAPAFDDRLEFFEGVNMCVLGCSSEQQGYEATAPTDTMCRYMYAMSGAEVDGEEQEYELTLDPYVLNGEATLYLGVYHDGEPETEEPLAPVILDEHAYIGSMWFEADMGNIIYVDPSTEEQHIATVDGNTFTPYVKVNPVNAASGSETITQNGTYTIDGTWFGADYLSSLEIDVSVYSSAGSDWYIAWKLGNKHDMSDVDLSQVMTTYRGLYNMFSDDGNPTPRYMSAPPVMDGSSIGMNGMSMSFYGVIFTTQGGAEISFPNLTTLNNTAAMYNAFHATDGITKISFPELTSINALQAMQGFFSEQTAGTLTEIYMPKLQNVSGQYAVSSWVDDYVTGMASRKLTVHVDALRYSYIDYNVAYWMGNSLTELVVTGTASYDIQLQRNPNLSAASVLNVLNSMGSGVHTCTFYTSGLTVTDDAQGNIQAAYNAAVNNGWTINNLTITPYS